MKRPRKEFPVSVRKAALARCRGTDDKLRCENKACGAVMTTGKYQFDHVLADGLGGKPTLANCMVICNPCHKEKTHKQDRPKMQKADNVKAYNEGTRAAPKQKIANRGFPASKPKAEKLPVPPRRDIFSHEVVR